MLEIVSASGPVAAFKASETLTGEDYERLIAELERQLQEHEQIAIFADVSTLKGLSLEALTRDIRYSASKLGELDRFARVAVVSDQFWLRAWTRLAWSLVPRALVKSFPSKERDAALAWAAELPPEQVHRGLRWLETNRSDTYAMAWSGTITDQDVDAAVKRLQPALESSTGLRLFVRVEQLGGVRPHALLQTGLVRLKALGLQKVERYAIVGGPAWLGSYAQVVQTLTGIEVRHYVLDQEPAAWAWLEAELVEPSAAAAESAGGAAHA
jgi:hypothetical protein